MSTAESPAREALPVVVFRWLLALTMVGFGVLHFVTPDPFMAIMPGYLPWHRELVLLSGLFEILGGVGLLLRQTREIAGWGLIALYLCVLPANVWQATEAIDLPGLAGPEWARWIRLPMQLVFIYWAYAVSRGATSPSGQVDSSDIDNRPIS